MQFWGDLLPVRTLGVQGPASHTTHSGNVCQGSDAATISALLDAIMEPRLCDK